MDFNIKKVSKWAWIKIGAVISIMVAALIFKPEFTDLQVNVIAGIIIAVIIFELLRATGILGKIFGKKE
jgi:hypothetical protein